MVLIYVKSGEWMFSYSEEWSFVVDKERRGRMVTLETTSPLETNTLSAEDNKIETHSFE